MLALHSLGDEGLDVRCFPTALNSQPSAFNYLYLRKLPRGLRCPPICMTTGNNQVVIENPVINSPFAEPQCHFRFSDEGITNEIVTQRRESAYFIPIAAPRKKGKDQLYFETEWTKDRIEPNKFINQVRSRVKQWRENKHFGVTRTTAQLLQYWTRSDRERRLFFCQIEALKTLIYLTEVAKQQGDTWIENAIHTANADANPLLYRIACKMATGSGKTVVMTLTRPRQKMHSRLHSEPKHSWSASG